MNLNFFFSGIEAHAYKYMGCHPVDDGIEFYLWAPHARKVEVFLSKDNYQKFYPLEKIDERGIWHLIINDCECIYSYKYRIYTDENNYIDKADPYAFFSELNPNYNSIMYDLSQYEFSDTDYLNSRTFSYEKPLNIYEIHANGFNHEDNEYTTYQQLRKELIPYVKSMGYTHIEFMPLTEYPFDGSWGYQATGFYSITSRYGTPWDLMDFINECHLNNIGVILDISNLHFAIDDFGLAKFDGECCYEYKDVKRRNTSWGSYYFDHSSGPVVSFLLSCANMFIEEYHFDGLRIDATSHLIYLNGEKDNGLNEDGLDFIKRYNHTLKQLHPDIMLIAEDSSDYPRVTMATSYDGLGFDYKWDLGWMNDTLKYYSQSFDLRKYCHNLITFSMAYFHNEKYLLPFSHDEVVHSKKTIIDKMYGEYDEKFSQCRNLYLYMYTHPGKKLNFMGNEIAMFREFDEKRGLDWDLLKYPTHDSFNRYIKDLNHIYLSSKALYAYDYESFSFKWIDADNYNQSIYVYARYDEDNCFVIVLNMSDKTYNDYDIGVPFAGKYIEIINSQKDIYSGSNICNPEPIESTKKKAHGLPNSISIDIAAFAAMIFMIKTNKKAPNIEEPDLLRCFDFT